MASIFKRSRWVDATGRTCAQQTLGARRVESRYYTIRLHVAGNQVKSFKGYMDKGASLQLAAKLERDKARGKEGLIDLFEKQRIRPVGDHVREWIVELRQLGRTH